MARRKIFIVFVSSHYNNYIKLYFSNDVLYMFCHVTSKEYLTITTISK